MDWGIKNKDGVIVAVPYRVSIAAENLNLSNFVFAEQEAKSLGRGYYAYKVDKKQ